MATTNMHYDTFNPAIAIINQLAQRSIASGRAALAG
jgi:hypothetical protein